MKRAEVVSLPQVDGYSDLVEIGRGGYAQVYRARQDSTGATVAVKVVTAHLLAEDGLRRFEQEYRAMRELSEHPHVVTVYGSGMSAVGEPFLIMEHLVGGSTSGRLAQDGPLPAAEAARLGAQTADALQAAHDRGFTHRDVKPENVLLDAMGDARLTDFGIAAIAGSSLRTASGVFLGSLLHSAPECLEGHRATAASDVYSLGSTLYELLAGTSARAHLAAESVAAILVRGPAEAPGDLRMFGVPDALATVVHQAMARDPAQRPASAGDLAQRLRDAVPPAAPTDADHWSRRSLQIRLGEPQPRVDDRLEVVLSTETEIEAAAPPSPPDPDPARATIAYDRRLGGPATTEPRNKVVPGLPYGQDPLFRPESRMPTRRRLLLLVVAVIVLATVAVGVLVLR